LPGSHRNKEKLISQGQHQVLSVFFIAASFLGVFFTLGYIVGRNSPYMIGPTTASAHETETGPAQSSSTLPAPREAVKTESPAQTVKLDTVKSAFVEKASAKAQTAEAPADQHRSGAAVEGGQPSGTYLQLVATSKAGVDAMVDELREKGFKAQGVEIPGKRGWFRALVGPVDNSSISTVRANLQAAGFPGEQAIARSF
jgi:cell division septation protein DedD